MRLALLVAIMSWSQSSCPLWQQDALRRLFQQDCVLTDSDYDELFALLRIGRGIVVDGAAKANPLSSVHLPTTPTRGATVVLNRMYDLQDVNRLATGQALTFAPEGITVIYGPNASGKSGYARVLKRACRARDDSEVVLPDARSGSQPSGSPRASFDIERGGRLEQVSWQESTVPPVELSEISVFDSRCARLYLTEEQDVTYLPYGLDIVEALARQVVPELERRLETEIATRPVGLKPFSHLLGDTAVGQLVQGLNAKTRPEEIIALATLSKTEEERRAALSSALAEPDPKLKAGELLAAVQRIKELVEGIDAADNHVSDRALGELQTRYVKATQAIAAEQEAAEHLRAGDPLLPGTGEATWKALYEAARRFSVEVAYPYASFPNIAQDAVCPLCQQPFSEKAAERLARFEVFVREDIAVQASAARKQLQQWIGDLESASLEAGLGAALESELTALDTAIAGEIRAFELSLSKRRAALVQAMRGASWDDVPAVAPSPRKKLRSLAAVLLWKTRAFDHAAHEGHREALTDELNELVARHDLAAVTDALEDVLSKMRERDALERCRTDLRTKPISDKSRDLASSAVTGALKTALEDEFSALEVSQVKLRLESRTVKGKTMHRLVLDLPVSCALRDVLSEGEQRAIAVGAFLAELSLAGHDGGVVFDDPVSSLDHWRRRKVAQRLVDEAEKRQVIVFTHDTAFLQQMRDAIEQSNVKHTIHSLEWRTDTPGYIEVGLPWDHQGYKERIDTLEKEQRQLQAMPWPQYPSEEQVALMAQQYSRLRATIERVIQDLVFCGVIVRFSDWVRVANLPGVAALGVPECAEIVGLYKCCCDFTNAHDASSFKNETVPTATDLGTDIARLRTVIETIKQNRTAAQVT
ncbi:MAG: AAA family ATPase [Thermoleophilia bacterium]